METTKSNRSIETVIDLNDNGKRLVIRTYHDKDRKRYLSYVARNVLSGNFIREIISLRGDERPIVGPRATETARFSAKTLENVHGLYLSDHAGMIPVLEDWARDQTVD